MSTQSTNQNVGQNGPGAIVAGETGNITVINHPLSDKGKNLGPAASQLAEKVDRSLVLLTSTAPEKNRSFGTGFIIRCAGDFTYIATRAHVIDDLGKDKINVDGKPGTVIVTGHDMGLDLAVVQVEALRDPEEILLLEQGECDRWDIGSDAIAIGFQACDDEIGNQTHRTRMLMGQVGKLCPIRAKSPNNSIRAWEVQFDELDVQPGYSGSPIIDVQTGKVFGVISHRVRDGVGVAIALTEINRIWQPVNINELRDALLRLGYRDQARLFRQALQRNPIGAYLIHGPTRRYGQQWLVNRLLHQFVPSSLSGQKKSIYLSRVGRRSDIHSLWEEMGVELMRDRRCPPKDMVKRVLKWWETQDLIIALYDVNALSEAMLDRLIQDFWLPLANLAEGMRIEGIENKLLMFLVDHEAVTAQRNVPLAQKIDVSSNSYYPVVSPENREFTKNEMTNWVEDHVSYFPGDLTDCTDEAVDEMYDMSDSGIPEWMFVEICKRCGYDWYELEKWYTI